MSVFLALLFYGTATTIFLTGLSPNVYFFDSKNIARYLFFIVPPPVILMILSVWHKEYMLVSILFILMSYVLVKMSFRKWNMVEQQTF